jgi:hypothetical protein
MGKGLGIAALVIAILSIFIPLYGIMTGWIALVLATLSALAGDRTFAVAVSAISLVAYVFLSPLMWMANAGANLQENSTKNLLIIISIVLVAAPVVGIILNVSGKLGIGGRLSPPSS